MLVPSVWGGSQHCLRRQKVLPYGSPPDPQGRRVFGGLFPGHRLRVFCLDVFQFARAFIGSLLNPVDNLANFGAVGLR